MPAFFYTSVDARAFGCSRLGYGRGPDRRHATFLTRRVHKSIMKDRISTTAFLLVEMIVPTIFPVLSSVLPLAYTERAILCLVFGLCMWVLSSFERAKDPEENLQPRASFLWMLQAQYHAYAAMLGGDDFVWETWPARIFRLGLLVFAVVILSTFTANLAGPGPHVCAWSGMVVLASGSAFP